jgi:hypothetical protein
MDQTPVARRQPDFDPDLIQVFRRYNARKLVAALRDHCYAEAQFCQQDGYTGMGWLELHDQLEDIMPSVLDEQMCGDAAPEVVVCRACRTGGDHCTC